jgi:hypothetical protein
MFDLHIRIFNLQGLGAPDKPKKKLKISTQKLILHLTTAFLGSGEINFYKIVKKTHPIIQPPERCLILTDNLSLIKAMLSRKIVHQTHPLVYEYQKFVLEPVPEWN